MSFLSQRYNGGLPDSSLNLCEQKGLTKLELRVHVIQTMRPLLPNFTLAWVPVPPVMSMNHFYTSQQRSKQHDGLLLCYCLEKKQKGFNQMSFITQIV